MVESHWKDVRGEEIRYHDHTWELTGDVDLRGSGELLGARARQVDGVQHDEAELQFSIADAGESLNPGNVGDVSAGLEVEGDQHVLLVEKEPRVYRYELRSMEYA